MAESLALVREQLLMLVLGQGSDSSKQHFLVKTAVNQLSLTCSVLVNDKRMYAAAIGDLIVVAVASADSNPFEIAKLLKHTSAFLKVVGVRADILTKKYAEIYQGLEDLLHGYDPLARFQKRGQMFNEISKQRAKGTWTMTNSEGKVSSESRLSRLDAMTRVDIPISLPDYSTQPQTPVIHPFAAAFSTLPNTPSAPAQVFQKQPVIPETPVILRSYDTKLAVSASTPNLNKEPVKKGHSATGFSMLKYCRLAVLVRFTVGRKRYKSQCTITKSSRSRSSAKLASK
mmetsp:Transcript_1182/g.2880  ORF Transcript_1182/g.2880 Transcript_1182/m.2880 type:complete len:286 (-) Transcript_1182:5249-6106(-)